MKRRVSNTKKRISGGNNSSPTRSPRKSPWKSPSSSPSMKRRPSPPAPPSFVRKTGGPSRYTVKTRRSPGKAPRPVKGGGRYSPPKTFDLMNAKQTSTPSPRASPSRSPQGAKRYGSLGSPPRSPPPSPPRSPRGAKGSPRRSPRKSPRSSPSNSFDLTKAKQTDSPY